MLLDTLTEVKNKISTPAVTKPSPVTAQASEKANQAKPQKKLPSADKKTEVKKASVGKISVSIPPDIKERDIKLIAIGASTGGTDAIIEVVQKLPLNTPPVVIVQHMPEGFTQMYAERLNRICIMDAKEAEDGDRLREGLIILAHGAKQMRVYKDAMGYYIKSQHGEKVSGHCPSVDVLFDSVSKIAGEEALGVILTGMGRDGARGLKSMRDAGSFTIGQNKETCVVYGMPAVAYDEGGVSVQAPLDEIGDIIIQITN
ncbi:MAG: chemotaxis protein CheB [Ruminiclostridium sp.]|nr:chemotaxis protein CheB [Ruminiclostridium sp.]